MNTIIGSSSWELLLEALDHLHGEGVMVVDDHKAIVFVNRRFQELCGWPPDFPAIGKPLSQVFGGLAERGLVMSMLDGRTLREWPTPAPTEGAVACHVRLPNSRTLQITGQRLSCGAISYSCADHFDQQLSLERLRRANKAAAINLATMAEFWDAGLGDHLHRVSRMTAEITTQLYRRRLFPDVIDLRFREETATSSILHDVGKFAIPESVVQKPGWLTPEEMDQNGYPFHSPAA